MNYRNIDDLNHCILQHLSILPRDFDLIVGIPRSGMFPANLLALYLNLPVTTWTHSATDTSIRPENVAKLST